MNIHPQIEKVLERKAGQILSLAKKIHANPEIGFEERKACRWQVELLKKWDFRVQCPFVGVSTAYKAIRGRGKPVFCFMAEYDALPEIGHACGHNLICSAAIGAGVALAEVLQKEKITGSVVVMGTPAEESKGGKVIMVKRGALRGIDAVIMAHPGAKTSPDAGSNAICRYDVTFKGKAAHAAGDPPQGYSALDAVILFFQGINAWRQFLPESSRVHGIILEGGVMPNIIPEQASCRFYLRSPDDAYLVKMSNRFKQIAAGAAMMTGTKFKISPALEAYKARLPNKYLNEAYLEAARKLGMNPVIPEHPERGSSDFGDVSQKVPGAHVYFNIAGKKKELPAHSIAFREAAGSEYGLQQMLRAANAMAQVGYRYFTDADFQRKVHEEFKRQMGKR